jgi:hypothetical protein
VISFLVPFRDADGTRTAAKDWIVARWRHFYPDAEFVIAPDDGVDPFCKSMAVNNAAARAAGDVFVILDADTWMEPRFFLLALGLVEKGVPWVIPARRALRLKQDVSERIMALPPGADLFPISGSYAEGGGAPVVGFIWVVPRAGFERIGGMDERIRGWGGEDTTFTLAMDRVVGKHRRLGGTLMCLWHARPRDQDGKRIWPGQGRRREEYAKEALAAAYTRAKTPAAMLQVLER